MLYRGYFDYSVIALSETAAERLHELKLCYSARYVSMFYTSLLLQIVIVIHLICKHRPSVV